MKTSGFAGGLLLVAVCMSAARAIEPDVVRAGKQATALVVLPTKGHFASASCIDKTGYLITSKPVVDAAGGRELQLVLHAGEKQEQTVAARVVRTDDVTNLALLKTDAKFDITPLTLADDELTETQEIVSIGFPVGKLLRAADKPYPDVALHVGRITSLPKRQGEVQRIAFDLPVDRGSSGGPLLNSAGEMIGVVVAGTGPSFAIPAADVAKFLATPVVQFAAPTIDAQQRYEPQTFSVQVASFAAAKGKYQVRLRLGEGKSAREVELKPQATAGEFAATLQLFIPKDHPPLQVEITFAEGLVRGEISDDALAVGKACSRWSQVKSIARDENRWRIVGTNGIEEVRDKLPLKSLTVNLGGANIDAPWSQATQLKILPHPAPPVVMPYEVALREGEKTIATNSGKIYIRGSMPDDGSAPFIPLDGSAAWPDYLETPPIATSKDGLQKLGRRYVRTPRGNYLKQDFTFELVLEMKRDDRIAFVGVGEGRSEHYEGEPSKSTFLRIHGMDLASGDVLHATHGKSHGENVGRIPAGTHRVTLQKIGDRMSFAIDVDNNGDSPEDIQQTITNLSEFAPFLDDTNCYLFFGGDANFKQVRLLRSAAETASP